MPHAITVIKFPEKSQVLNLQWVIAIVPYDRIPTVDDNSQAVCSHFYNG